MYKPAKIVKFFKTSDLNYFRKGQIRLGTLEGYRSLENEVMMGARFDSNEGVAARDYRFEGEFAKRVRIPGLSLTNVRINGNFGRVRKSFHFNEWVFCSSSGPYRKALHEGIICGLKDENGYPGDNRLTCYAVFDTDKLENAINKALTRLCGFQLKDGSPNLISGLIDYSKAPSNRVFSSETYQDNGIPSVSDWNKALFTKDKFFLPETEFRIIVRVDCSEPLDHGAEPLVLKSNAIKRSIDSFGTWHR